jgi:hypothetical protein
MAITCDICGKHAPSEGVPRDVPILRWLGDMEIHGDYAMTIVPSEEGLLIVSCCSCIRRIFQETFGQPADPEEKP